MGVRRTRWKVRWTRWKVLRLGEGFGGIDEEYGGLGRGTAD